MYGDGKPEWDNTGNMRRAIEAARAKKRTRSATRISRKYRSRRRWPNRRRKWSRSSKTSRRARASARREQDWMELRAFAATELGMPELQPWDIDLRRRTSAPASAIRSPKTR
jgi:oligopeptidase A